MSGFELGVLKHRLEADGRFRAVAFSYPSISGSMSDHVRGLLEFARAQNSDQLHFVGHSLGGLLGSPVQGCRAAQGVVRLPFGKAILGAAVNEEVVQCTAREWKGHREIGVIAGSMGLGLGRLFAHLETDHDGTVLVEETRLPGAKDHIVLETSHTGMLFSPEVAEQAAYFLTHGVFRRESR
jgi:hypothetical protein